MLKNFGGTLTNLGGFFEPPVDWTNDNSILVWLQKLPTFILYPVIDREEVLSPTENLLDHFTAHIWTDEDADHRICYGPIIIQPASYVSDHKLIWCYRGTNTYSQDINGMINGKILKYSGILYRIN